MDDLKLVRKDLNLEGFIEVFQDFNFNDIRADNPDADEDALDRLVIEEAKKYLFDMLEDDELDPTFHIKEVELP